MSRDFASRWKERRERIADEEAALEVERQRPAPSEEDIAAEHARNRAEAEAIDVESIDRSTDVSAFLKEGVPDLLRRRALRQLWRSDPVFANIDRLNDYDENFADPSKVMATLQSAWQVGRGYARAETSDDQPDDDGTSTEPAATNDPVELATVDDATSPEAPQLAEAPSEPIVTAEIEEDGSGDGEPALPAELSLRARLGI